MKPKRPACIVCSSAPERAHWRCDSCLRYLNRTGRDRPATVLDRAVERSMLDLGRDIGDTFLW